jgi:hypothetical protein
VARALLIVALVAVAFWVYTIVDCAVQHPTRHRGVSKPVWILIVVVLPVLGGILWLTIGRGSNKSQRLSAPDDDPAFLANLGSISDQDERIRRLEEELANLDEEDDIWQRGSGPDAPPTATPTSEAKGATPPSGTAKGDSTGDQSDGDDTRGHRGAVG